MLPLAVLDRPARDDMDLAALPAVRPAGLYVHVPFCFHKCHYCDFYSITRQTHQRMARFVDLVLAEADLWLASPVELRPDTIFFGGGTPSLLPRDEMARLLEGLRVRAQRSAVSDQSQKREAGSEEREGRRDASWPRAASGLTSDLCPLTSLTEWTVEVNPATADLDYLRMMRAGGVDRISFGAQSFNERELAMLERHHDPADVPRAVEMARDAGFARISIDLIYAIPGQTLDSWRRSLDAALALETEHLSCYGLTYEPNTPLAVRKRLGRVQAAPEELEVQMFQEARRVLAGEGLPAYEVSNYCRPGAESLHNLAYWTGESYIGLGPAAASHIDGRRFRNEPHLGRWESAVSAGRLPIIEYEHLTPRQRCGELAMLNLRLSRGIDLADFAHRTAVDAREVFSDQLAELTSLELLEQADGHIRLTDKAWPVADAVAARFLG